MLELNREKTYKKLSRSVLDEDTRKKAIRSHALVTICMTMVFCFSTGIFLSAVMSGDMRRILNTALALIIVFPILTYVCKHLIGKDYIKAVQMLEAKMNSLSQGENADETVLSAAKKEQEGFVKMSMKVAAVTAISAIAAWAVAVCVSVELGVVLLTVVTLAGVLMGDLIQTKKSKAAFESYTKQLHCTCENCGLELVIDKDLIHKCEESNEGITIVKCPNCGSPVKIGRQNTWKTNEMRKKYIG